jgi:hypothetical protein
MCRRKDHVLIIPRSPTLSYTQRLEHKVAQLEAALVEVRGTAINPQVEHVPEVQSSESNVRYTATENTEALGTGSIALNQSISLFQLPGNLRTLAVSQEKVDQEMAATRETLVNNAWRERAYERLADTPVYYRYLNGTNNMLI